MCGRASSSPFLHTFKCPLYLSASGSIAHNKIHLNPYLIDISMFEACLQTLQFPLTNVFAAAKVPDLQPSSSNADCGRLGDRVAVLAEHARRAVAT